MEQFYTTLETKASKEDDRIIEFIATKEVVDRDGEILKVDGIKTTNYKKNPIVLWAHDRAGLPIGKTTSTRKVDGEFRMKVQFATPEEYGFADTVYKLVKGGYLNAVSIGFMPNFEKIEYPPQTKKGNKVFRIFHEVDLLEMSVVPIGANQSALSIGKAISDGVIDEVEKQEWDLYCKKVKLEEKSPFIAPDGALELTDDEKNERIDELEVRVVELEAQMEDKKSYLHNLFNKDTSSTDKEDQTDEDELNDEDRQEIYNFFNPEEEEEKE